MFLSSGGGSNAASSNNSGVAPVNDSKTILQAHLGNNLAATSFVAGNANVVLDTLGTGNWKFYVGNTTSIASITAASAVGEWTGGNLLSAVEISPGTLVRATFAADANSRIPGKPYLLLDNTGKNSTTWQFVNLPSFSIPATGFSFAFWFRIDNATRSNNDSIVDFRTNTDNSTIVGFNLTPLGLLQYQTGGAFYNSTYTMPTNTWVHIAVTVDPTATAKAILYINGGPTNTPAGTKYTLSITYPPTGTRTYNNIGTYNSSGDPVYSLKGTSRIDNFKIFTKILSDVEVITEYNRTSIDIKLTQSSSITTPAWMPTPGTVVDSSETLYTVKSNEVALTPGENSTYAVWTATKSTNLKIDVSFADYNSRSANGVGFQMFKIKSDNTFDSVLFPRTVTSTALTNANSSNSSNYLTVPTINTTVNAGDKIYYRVDGNGISTSASSVLATAIYTDAVSVATNPVENKLLQAQLATNLNTATLVAGNTNTVLDTLGSGDWKFYVAPSTSIAAITSASASDEWSGGSVLPYVLPPSSPTDMSFWYTFNSDKVSGTTVSDFTGTYSATLVNNATIAGNGSPGPGQGYLSLTQSSSQYLNLNSNSINITTAGFTIVMWFRATNTNGVGSAWMFDMRNTNNSNIFAVTVGLDAGNPGVRLYTPQTTISTLSPSDIRGNVWRHLAITIEYFAGVKTSVYKCYLDGVLQSTNSDNYPATGTRNNNYLGYGYGAAASGYFDGGFDDFRVFNRAITAEEVTAIYSQPSIYYPFDVADINGSTPTLIGEYSTGSYVYSGTLVNNATIAVDGNSRVSGQGYLSLSSASSTQYVNLTSSISTGANGLSFAFWYRLDATRNHQRFFSFSNGVHTQEIMMGVSAGSAYFLACASFDDIQMTLSPIYSNNTWNHVVWTITPISTKATWRIYVNGAITETQTVKEYPEVLSNRANNWIGRGGFTAPFGGDARYNGGIDDFRFYNRVITDAEVSALYAGPQPPALKDVGTGVTWLTKPAVAVDATETSYTVKSTEIALKPGTNSTYAVWTAPKSTNIKIDVSFADYHSRSTSGVGFQMFKINADNTFGSTIFPRTTTVSAITDATLLNGTSSYLTVPSKTISVAAGDKIYYRIDGNGAPTLASSVLATNIYVDPNPDLKQNTILQAHLGNNLTATSFVSGNANVVNDTLRTGNWNFYVAGNTSIASITGASGSSGEWTVGNLLSYVAPTPPVDYSVFFPFETANINPGNPLQVGDLASGTPVYNGTLVGGATIEVVSETRVSGQGYLSMSSSSAQHLSISSITFGANGLTFAFWYRLNDPTLYYQRFFEFEGGIIMGVYAATNTLLINNSNFPNCPIYNNNTWNHLVWTLTPTSGTATWRVYINGVFTHSILSQAYPTIGTKTTNWIGRGQYTVPGFDRYFNGGIDDFRIYQRPLTPTEVTALYAGPSPPSLKDVATSTSATWMPVPGTPVDSSETNYTVKSNEVALTPGANSTYAVWTATKSTNLKIDVSFADYHSRSTNGVGFQMFKIKANNTFDSVLFPRTVTSTALTNANSSNYLTIPSINTTVTVGDKIYYRVDGNGISTSASSVLATAIYTDAVSAAVNPVETKLVQAQLATNLSNASLVAGNANTVLDTLGSGNWNFYVGNTTSTAAITSASAVDEWTGGSPLSYNSGSPIVLNYEFDAANQVGSTIQNLATGDYALTLMNGASIATASPAPYSTGYLSMNISNGQYATATVPFSLSRPWAISFWHKYSGSFITGGSNPTLFEIGNTAGFGIRIESTPNWKSILSYANGTNLLVSGGYYLNNRNDASWTHYVINYDGGYAGYTNTENLQSGFPNLNVTTNYTYINFGKSNMSSLTTPTGGSYVINIDKFQIFNRTLTVSEIASLYGNTFNPVGNPKFTDAATGVTWISRPGFAVDPTTETSYTVKSTEIALIPGTNSTYAVWTAPKSTNLKIDVSFADYHSRSTSGVGFQMFKINRDNTFGSVIFPRTTTGNAITDATLLTGTSSYLSVPSRTISVATGDKIYYRIDGNGAPTLASSVLATNIYVDPNQDLKQNTILQAHLGNNLTATSFVAGNANVVNDTLGTGNWKFYVAPSTSIEAITGASNSTEWTVGNLLSYSLPSTPPVNYSIFYPFDSDSFSGTNVGNKATGSYVNDAVLTSSATISTSQYKYGTASLYLNNPTGGGSASQHLKLPTFTISQSTGFSVSLWVYNVRSALETTFLFDFSTSTSAGNNSMMLNLTGSNRYQFYSNYSSNSAGVVTSPTENVRKLNQWSHVCITINTSNFTTIYVDLVSVYSGTPAGSAFAGGAKTSAMLGATYFGNTSFYGYIDDFKIYNRPLTLAEVTALYTGPSPAKLSDTVTTTGATWMPIPGTPVDSTETLYTVKSNEVALTPGTNSTYAVWTATKSTNLKIDVSFADYNSRSANGVGFQMFKIKSDNTFDSVLFPRTVTSTALTNVNSSNYLTVPSINTTVNAGDKIYYRVDGNGISTSASSVLATAIYTDAVSTAVNPVETKLVQAQLATNLSNASLVAGNANTILDTTGAGDWKFYVAPSTSIAAITSASASDEWSGGSILPYVLPPSVPTDMSLCFTFNSDKVSGTTISDSVGNFTATLVNSATIATNGSPGPGQGYLSLTRGTGIPAQYVKFVQPFSILQNGITVTTWFRATSNNSGANGRIYDFRPGNQSSEFSMSVSTGGIGLSGGGTVYSTNVLDNVWRHVALTVEYAGVGGASSIYKIYINGVLQTTLTPRAYPIADSRTLCNIGGYINLNTENHDGTFDGGIDDFRIYQRPLTAEEVSLIYSQPSMYFPLNVADINPSITTQVGEYSTGSYVYNGILTRATIAVDGNSRVSGQGYLSVNGLSGTSGSAQYLTLPTIRLTQSTGFSISLWVYPYLNNDGFIFDFRNASGVDNFMFACYNVSSSKKFVFYPYGTDFIFTENNSMTYDKWNHVCITISPTNFTTIYVDSVSRYSNTPALPSGNNAFSGDNAKTLAKLGSTYLGNNGLGGGIDDFRVYQRVLSQAEVSALYAGTQPPTLKDTVTGATWLTNPAIPVDATENLYTVKSTEIALKPGANSTYAVWTSPKSTNIRLDVSFADYHSRSTSGVGFQIFKINADNTFGSVIFPRTTTVSALTDLAPTNYLTVPSTSLSVNTGDKVVYRIDGNGAPTSSSSVLATNIYSYSGRWY